MTFTPKNKVAICLLASFVVAYTYPPPKYDYPPPPKYDYPAPQKYPPPKVEKANPYELNYDFLTDDGASVWQQENGNEKGEKSGSYGYKDAYGVYRYVDYWADANGFRAKIKTNEPGTDDADPADVDITAYPPPKYTAKAKPPKASYKSPEPSSYPPPPPPKETYKPKPKPPQYKTTKASPPPPSYEPPLQSYEIVYPPSSYPGYGLY
ncbi:extensin-like [Centruroides sculpturatus]|uniref:extensin-like n=1 Tax=Centruroides sculpturatus TaxID=218467 RepID=UPI000C6EB4D1|nr:extensin-like [Centruroides sculpturatus]